VEPTTWSALEIARAVTAGERSAVAVAEHYLERARQRQPEVNGFSALLAARALEQAEAVDRRLRDGAPVGPLAGVPCAVKANICTAGDPTTCGSAILDDYRPPYDATAVSRLRDAGAVLLGKANCDEFAMGSSNETSAHWAVRHPLYPDRVPGGSSGGSAALVADGQAALSLGSDTGGSVRQPAAFCGVVGLKPTYGRVSRHGLVAFGSSLEQIGPLGRTVSDAATAFRIIAGPDGRDATCTAGPVEDPRARIEEGPQSLILGAPREYLEAEGLDPEVGRAVRETLDRLAGAGAEVREISLAMTPYAIPIYYLVADAEASSNLARYDGVRFGVRAGSTRNLRTMYGATRGRGFGTEVKRRIMLGTFALSTGYYDAFYRKAQRARTRLREEIEAVLAEVDAIVTPTTPTPAFRLGEKLDDPLAMYLSDVFTVPANLAGLPALSVPCGRSGDGLPIGLQVMGPPGGEALIFRVARAVELFLPGDPPSDA
jgi:aspartyl-tRNA(Asn)/glutamyl-tRNA(Gln) amidotransferase subunit A